MPNFIEKKLLKEPAKKIPVVNVSMFFELKRKGLPCKLKKKHQ